MNILTPEQIKNKIDVYTECIRFASNKSEKIRLAAIADYYSNLFMEVQNEKRKIRN